MDFGRDAARMSRDEPSAHALPVRRTCGFVLAPIFLLLPFFVPAPEGLSPEGWRMAGIALTMATLWISEAIPIPATALLPLILIPAADIDPIRDAAAPYAHPLIFLFFGGFLIALAMQKWGLHFRIALAIVRFTGTSQRGIIAGFLLAAAVVSMWMNNTATTLMLAPVALSIIALLEKEGGASGDFPVALLLAVAYGANIGGVGTLIGTAPNALLAGFVQDAYGYEVGFAQWLLIGVPLILLGLPVIFLLLTRWTAKVPAGELPGAAEVFRKQREELGPISRGEISVALVFGMTVTLWMTRPLLQPHLPFLSDTLIAMTGGILLFLLPVHFRKGEFVLDWETVKGMPWGVLLLFGGGLSMASGIEGTGLATFLAQQIEGLDGVGIVFLIAVVALGILVLTELTSNTATAATFLPVAGALAVGLGENPLLLTIPVALASSCAFMLPVATPPNAVVFASGKVPMIRMVRAGIGANLLFLALICLLVATLGPIFFAM